MPDVHDAETRGRNMAAIRSAHTKPELLVRKSLHALGFRFRLHARDLPGKPDLVLPKYSAVIFVQGCFWHGHDCSLFRMPGTRTDFWEAKISGNRERDARTADDLTKAGWRVGEIWECSLKGPDRLEAADVTDRCAAWLRGTRRRMTVRGRKKS